MTWTLWEGLGFPVLTSIIVPQPARPADQVGLAAQGGRLAPEGEAVLVLCEHRVSPFLPVLPALVESGRMLQLPTDQVEGAGDPIPAPSFVLGPEPRSPLAGVLAGQQLGEPGYPDVGAVPQQGHLRFPDLGNFGRSWAQEQGVCSRGLG